MRRPERRFKPREVAPKKAGSYAPRLVIMLKIPRAGQVKTRLAREIGTVRATWFYRHALQSLLARLGRQAFWQTILLVTPDAELGSRMLPAGTARLGQGKGDLGRRMQRPMKNLPPGPVCLMGSDIPDVRVEDIRRAFKLLGQNSVVFGPAEDGGFWLVGLRRRPRLIDPYAGGVPWSQADTLARTLAHLSGVRVGFTARHHDVDTAADLFRNAGRHARRVLPLPRR